MPAAKSGEFSRLYLKCSTLQRCVLFLNPPAQPYTFFSFFLKLLSGYIRAACKEFHKKIPHDEGAQEIFLWNSVAILERRTDAGFLCERKEEKLVINNFARKILLSSERIYNRLFRWLLGQILCTWVFYFSSAFVVFAVRCCCGLAKRERFAHRF